MCQVSSSAPVGQDSPLFHVALIDARGQEHGYIGYTFHAPGAQAAANGWNNQADRTLTAVIRDGLPPVSKAESYGVVVTHESGKVAMLNLAYGTAENAQADADKWQTETTRAVVAPLARFDDFAITLIPFASQPKHFELELQEAEERDAAEMEEQAANAALDERGQDSDSDIEGEDESATSDEPEGSTFGDDDLNVGYLLALMVDDAQRAAERGDLSLMASLGVRYTLMRYLQSIMGAVYHNRVQCALDIGMIAAGLERFVCQMIEGKGGEGLFESESDDFNLGRNGDYSNPYGTLEALTHWLDRVGDPTAVKAA